MLKSEQGEPATPCGALPFPRWVQWLCPSPYRFVQKLILEKELKTGLDIGCGGNSILSPLRQFGFHSTGIDVWSPALDDARARDLHDEHILGDFRSIDLAAQFDVVVMHSVLEHFTRDEGMDVLRRVESIADCLTVVGVPNGFLEQLPLGGNPFQRHFSGWFAEDFQRRGYNVFGSGLRFFRGPAGVAKRLPEFAVRSLERSLAWVVLRRPRFAHGICAVRYIDETGAPRQI